MRTRIVRWGFVGGLVGWALAASACELIVGGGDYKTAESDSGGGGNTSGTGTSGTGASGTGASGTGASGTGTSGTGTSGTGTSGTGASGTGTSGTGTSGASTSGASGGACTVAPNTCAAGEACRVGETADGGTFYAACAAPGSGTEGASCSSNATCGAGLGCFGPLGSSTCHPWCQRNPTPTTCSPGTACVDVNPPLVISGIAYGACLTCAFPAGSACSVYSQCGCPYGQKCDIGGTAAAACTTAGSAGEGARCSLNTDCAAGLTCAGGVCHVFCNQVNTACAAGGECLLVGNGAQPQDKICSIDCKLAPNTCAAGEVCFPFMANGVVRSDCEAAGSATRGSSCTSNSDCAPGLGCDSPSGSMMCLPWCELSPTATACNSGTCSPFQNPIIVDGVTYGYCYP